MKSSSGERNKSSENETTQTGGSNGSSEHPPPSQQAESNTVSDAAIVSGGAARASSSNARPNRVDSIDARVPRMIPLAQEQDGRSEVFAVECPISRHFYDMQYEGLFFTGDIDDYDFWTSSDIIRGLTGQNDFHVLMRLGSDTAFDLVLRFGCHETLKLFVDHSTFRGEYINSDGHGGFPLFDVVMEYNVDKLQVLINHPGCDVRTTWLDQHGSEWNLFQHIHHVDTNLLMLLDLFKMLLDRFEADLLGEQNYLVHASWLCKDFALRIEQNLPSEIAFKIASFHMRPFPRLREDQCFIGQVPEQLRRLQERFGHHRLPDTLQFVEPEL